MSYKLYSSAYVIGLRDGKDAFLLDRKLNNPYDPIDDRIAYQHYEDAWYQGYEEEQSISE